MRRVPRISATVVTALVLAGSAATASAATSVSTNWAGYAVTTRGAATGFRTVSGSWVVTPGSCSQAAAYSSTWVGLGGFDDKSAALEQIGTEFDCTNSGRAIYSAWYELVPADSHTIKLPVKPGDVIDASVTVRGTNVVLNLANRTRGWRFHRDRRMSSPDITSAEWIVEAPSDCGAGNNCTTLPLSNFGTVPFSRASITDARGRSGSIATGAWSATRVLLTGAGAPPRFAGAAASSGASASALSARGTAFSVTYENSQPIRTQG
jgi:hypothetical protein